MYTEISISVAKPLSFPVKCYCKNIVLLPHVLKLQKHPFRTSYMSHEITAIHHKIVIQLLVRNKIKFIKKFTYYYSRPLLFFAVAFFDLLVVNSLMSYDIFSPLVEKMYVYLLQLQHVLYYPYKYILICPFLFPKKRILRIRCWNKK